MKKYIVILAAALAVFSSCSKRESDGAIGDKSKDNVYARAYMMCIVDNLATDILNLFEDALEVNADYHHRTTQFDFSGWDFCTPGTIWTVKPYPNPLQGLMMECIGENRWSAIYNGDYVFGDSSCFPTNISMTLERGAESGQKGHFNWNITLEGNRTEDNGYSCLFRTDAVVSYGVSDRISSSNGGWDVLTGIYYLEVMKDGKVADYWKFEMNGSSAYSGKFSRGL